MKFVSGSVEAACGLGLADAVVDLVETGTTMRAAGLEVVADILETQSQLIANTRSEHKDIIDLIKLRFEGYLTAQKYVLLSYNCSTKLLANALEVTPGKTSATISSLDDPHYKAVAALVKKNELSAKMDELHKIGASDILAFEISNSRM